MNTASLNHWQVTAIALLGAAAMLLMLDPNIANAAPPFLTSACRKVNDVWQYAQRTIYIVGGIGIIVCAVFAFIGRFRWSLLFAIAGGVFLVASASQLFQWLAQGTGGATGGAC